MERDAGSIEDVYAPDAKKIIYPSREDAMEAVKAGDADVAFVYYYTAQEFVNNDSSGSVRYSLVNQPSFQYRIALAPRINHALADKMRGTIEFQSKQGVGTTAIIKIPFKLGPQDISSKTTNYDNVSVEGMQVLVVDDNELNVEIAKCMLENNGMKVTCAADGHEAVELFEKSEPGYYGAIFMDVMMPRMDGLEATKTIRNMKRSDAWNVPIIAISANAFMEDILNSKQAGMNAHLAKPLDVNKLLEALKKCLAENSELKIREDL